jgi:hypothetical protein
MSRNLQAEKLGVCLALVVAFLVATNVRADVVSTGSGTWKVATIETADDPGTWEEWWQCRAPEEAARIGGFLATVGNFEDVAHGAHPSWVGATSDNYGNWITTSVEGSAPNSVANGFYGFKTTLTVGDDWTQNLTYWADDALAAVYVNTGDYKKAEWTFLTYDPSTTVGYLEDNAGSLSLDLSDFADYLRDGQLELMFVVHNTFQGGTAIDAFANPTGLRIQGATPEPATMAIVGLGLAGLGLARRRRK